MQGYKIFDETTIRGIRLAILIPEDIRDKRALEAVWNDTIDDWETDFSYFALKISLFDVDLDFEGAENRGYEFWK